MTIRMCTIRFAFALAVGFTVSAVGMTPEVAAQIASGKMTVSANVPVVCTLQTNPLNFGPYSPTNPIPAQARTTTDVTCSQGYRWVVEYDNGLHSLTGDCTSRRMVDATGAGFLHYLLFDAVPGGPLLGLIAQQPVCNQHVDIGTGGLQQPVVFGEIPPLQPAVPGAYSDTIVVTLW